MMKYKNYLGSMEVSLEDNVLHGKLLYIKDLVTYEADNPKSLEDAFHEAVECYLEDCKAEGVVPDVPCKGSFNVRISPKTHRSLVVSAHSKGCALNEYVKTILDGHEENKNSSSSTTHYHFNFGGRSKQSVAKVSESSQISSQQALFYTVNQSKPGTRDRAEQWH